MIFILHCEYEVQDNIFGPELRIVDVRYKNLNKAYKAFNNSSSINKILYVDFNLPKYSGNKPDILPLIERSDGKKPIIYRNPISIHIDGEKKDKLFKDNLMAIRRFERYMDQFKPVSIKIYKQDINSQPIIDEIKHNDFRYSYYLYRLFKKR